MVSPPGDEKAEIAAGILGYPQPMGGEGEGVFHEGEKSIEAVRAVVIEKEGRTIFLKRPVLEEPKALATVLPALLRPLRQKHSRLECLKEKWRTLVGEELSAQMFPLTLHRGVLTVGVADEGLRYEMASFHAFSLLKTIRAYFPDSGIRKLRFVMQRQGDGNP